MYTDTCKEYLRYGNNKSSTSYITFQKCHLNLKLHESEFEVSLLILGVWLLQTLHSVSKRLSKFEIKDCNCSVPAFPGQDDCICLSILLMEIHLC